MSDDLIFREVDEDLRHDQLREFWKRFGAYIIGAALVIVLGVAGYKGWTWYAAEQAADSGSRFEQALIDVSEGRESEALKTLETLAADGSGDYPQLARLTAAAAKARAGDIDGALADYDAIAASSGDPLLSDLARVKGAVAALDTAPRAELQRRIGDLASSSGPWQNMARETLALAAYREGDLTAASSGFQQIVADTGASPELRQRAELMLALIAPQQAAMPQEPAQEMSGEKTAGDEEPAEQPKEGQAE